MQAPAILACGEARRCLSFRQPTLIKIKMSVPVLADIQNCMGNLIFKCPRTGMNVQHWLEEPRAGDPSSSYETVVCKACTRLHFINRMTRKLLGEKEQ
jgi:hypothetical protein